MNDSRWPHRLFDVFGIEIELMIVDKDTFDVRPICDRVLAKASEGKPEMEIERGDLAWSNELALHVIELKTNGPAKSLTGLGERFMVGVREVQALLDTMGATLLPSAMHPWMDPGREMKLWPHEGDVIYSTLDRIFDCRGHGWANLQSMHINLPFSNDEEMGRLHAAIRLALPLLPALAASSPYCEGKAPGSLDFRLETYRTNARKVPSVSGMVIPERVFTHDDYQNVLLKRIYDDMAPHDPEGVLRHEWVNARGAIARFDRGAIEIRILDVQENPLADLAVAHAVTGLVRALVEEKWMSWADQKAVSEEQLALSLQKCVKDADAAVIDDDVLLRAVGLPGSRVDADEIWQHLIGELDLPEEAKEPLTVIVDEGPLARRLLSAAGRSPERQRLQRVYRQLNRCLLEGKMFHAQEV